MQIFCLTTSPFDFLQCKTADVLQYQASIATTVLFKKQLLCKRNIPLNYWGKHVLCNLS